MKKFITILILLIIAVFVRIFSNYYFTKEIIVEGVMKKNIYFGQTINLNNEVPVSYSNGIVLAFEMINRFGGINGNKLNLFIYNDDYDKEKSIKNAKILLEYDNVLGLIGSWGTPTSYSIFDKVIGQRHIPFIAPLTGSNLIKVDPDNVMIIRPSYRGEINIMLNDIVSKGLKNIAIIYQNDEYGISCMNDLTNLYSINDYPINIISASYDRNSSYLLDTFKKLLGDNEPFIDSYKRNSMASNIDAILLFGTSKQEPYVINFFKKLKPDIYFYNLSFVGENLDTLQKLRNKSNIYITNVLHVNENYSPILYNNLLREIKYNNSINPYLKTPIIMTQNLIEGFIAGIFTANILKRVDHKNINRENFIKALYKEKENYIDVFDLRLGPFISNQDSKGLRTVYLLKYNEDTNRYE